MSCRESKSMDHEALRLHREHEERQKKLSLDVVFLRTLRGHCFCKDKGRHPNFVAIFRQKGSGADCLVKKVIIIKMQNERLDPLSS
jgi:hypothetical protein